MSNGKLVLVLLLSGLLLSSAAFASSAIMYLPSTANIFGAGHTSVPAWSGQIGGAGTLPVQYSGAIPTQTAPTPYLYLHFPGMSGQVSCCAGANGSYGGPDGFKNNPAVSTNIDSPAGNGISGIKFDQRFMFIVGVFLGANEPTGTNTNKTNYTGADSVTDFFPQIGQTFFIGNGLTTGGQQQRFWVPVGASRLYLGFADGDTFVGLPQYYDDNKGGFTVNGRVDAAPEPASLALVGVALLGLGWRFRKRSAR